MKIRKITTDDVEDERVIESMNKLLKQLVGNNDVLVDENRLKDIVNSSTVIFVANVDGDDKTIIGMTSLTCSLIPTGKRFIIEDVVVDDKFRGKGIATLLINESTRHAAANGAKTVDLTSRPDRIAANQLYIKLGFQKRDTNVYRLHL